MPERLGVGWVLQPDQETLELTAELALRECDYYEVAPETTWFADERGRLQPNGFHAHFAAVGARTGRPFVAHGVGLSLASTGAGEAARRRRWLNRIRLDQAVFGYRWYTDHLGMTRPDSLGVTLPLMSPMTPYAAALTRRRLRALQAIVPDVGVENSVVPFLTGPALDEPAFITRVLAGEGLHLLLDLHNVYTMSVNFGFEPAEWLSRVDLARVIEIHLSGGAMAPARWLPEGPALRLDGHDSAVPDAVWSLFEAVLPRCPNLRGVTLERMEGSVSPVDVPELRDELRRIRQTLMRLA